MSTATQDPKGISIPTDRTFYAERQVREAEGEIQQLRQALASPASQIEDRAAMSKMLKRAENDLETQAPPETTPEQRDALSKEEKVLLDKIVPAMLSQEEMRKCPPGAIGGQVRFEKTFKADIIRLKNIQRIMNKGNDDPDACNLERYRGTKNTLNMHGAMIPGKQHFVSPNTEAYKAGYERVFERDETPEQELARLQQEFADLQARINAEQAPALESTPEPVAIQAPADPVQESVTDEDKPFRAMAACGKEFRAKAQHRANFGKAGHERGCKECKEKLGTE